MRVLAIQPGALGDFILTLPALTFLRDRCGDEGMEVWAEHAHLALLPGGVAGRPLVDTGFDSYPLPQRAVEAMKAFDVVVSWRGAALPELVAAVQAAHPRAYFLPQFPPDGEQIHLCDFRARQMQELFGGACGTVPSIDTGRNACATATGIAIHPGASGRRKQWGAEKFAEVARQLAAGGGSLRIIEGPLDAEACNAMGSFERVRLDNLREVAGVLAGCELFIGNDSGVAHLAAACGTPVVAIFTATDPACWAPRGARVRVLERPSVDDVVTAAREVRCNTVSAT